MNKTQKVWRISARSLIVRARGKFRSSDSHLHSLCFNTNASTEKKKLSKMHTEGCSGHWDSFSTQFLNSSVLCTIECFLFSFVQTPFISSLYSLVNSSFYCNPGGATSNIILHLLATKNGGYTKSGHPWHPISLVTPLRHMS